MFVAFLVVTGMNHGLGQHTRGTGRCVDREQLRYKTEEQLTVMSKSFGMPTCSEAATTLHIPELSGHVISLRFYPLVFR